MKHIQTAAIFMICLILTLPFYSASVFAQTTGLTNVKVQEADEYDGYARSEDDTFKFSARACVAPGEDVEAKQVRLWGYNNNTGFPFDEPCTSVGDGCSYDCTFQRVMSDYIFCPHTNFVINLYNKSGSSVANERAEVVCDTQAPSFSSVSRNRSIVNLNGKIKITSVIKDSACTGISGCPSTLKCVGFQKIEFSAQDYSAERDIDTELCTHTHYLEELGSSFKEGAVTLTVTAYDNFGQSSTATVSFTVDTIQPSILFHSFEITDIDGDEITYFTPQTVKAVLIVNITDANLDTATIEEDFSSLELTTTPYKSCPPIGTNKVQCTYSNMQFYLDSASFSKSITISASDTAGNEIEQQLPLSHESFTVDSIAPVIDGLIIKDASGNIIDWHDGTAFDANIYVNITEREIGLDQSTVYANFSELNPTGSYAEKKPKTGCAPTNNPPTVNVTQCWWNSININIDETGDSVNKNIIFYAGDLAGNNATPPPSLSYTFKFDNSSPHFVSLGTTRTNSSGHSFVGSGENTFIAEIKEEGSGLNHSKVFIDLSNLELSNEISAYNCTYQDPLWFCNWTGITINEDAVSEGLHEINNNKEATVDNVGNECNNTLKVNVTVDTTAPSVNSVNITPEEASPQVTPVIEGYILTGNYLSITVNLTEINGLSEVVGDFSSIITGATSESPTTPCSKSGDYWICEWSTSAINIEESGEKTIKFNFTDIAGNILPEYEVPITITVYDDDDVEPSDYWKHTIKAPSPAAIDRELVARYDSFVYFPIEIEPNEPGKTPENLWPVSVELGGDCTGSGVDYISSANVNKPELFNYNNPRPTSEDTLPYPIYFKFTMDRGNIPTDTNNISINCTLKIKTLVDSTSISPDETNNLTFSILYYNNPLGTMDSRITDEIERVKNSWLVDAEWLDTLNKILTYAKKICKIYEILYKIAALLSLTKDGLSSCCNTGWGSAICCPNARLIGKTQGGFKDVPIELTWRGVGNFFCKMTSCQLFYGSKWAENSNSVLAEWLEWAQETYGSRQGYFGNIDPQHSIILSVVFLCLPGVIYGLQKARVIDCMYINCLKQTQYGMPLYLCTYQRAYAYCKFVYGEIFNLIPFAAVISQLGQNVLKAMSHWIEAVGFLGKLACRYWVCKEANTLGCTVCSYAEFANWIMDIICDLGTGAGCTSFWESLSVDDSVCEDALAD